MPRKRQRLQCSARSRQNGGARCRGYAVKGSRTCRMHGGTHPKGGAAPQATKNLKHGLYAKAFTDEERRRFEEMLPELLNDPTAALMADAALLRIKAATALGRADEAGMIVRRQSALKRTEPVLDPATGRQMTYRTDDGEVKPLITTVESVSAERSDVISPVSDLLMKAAKLACDSVMLRKRAGLIGEEEIGTLDESTMAEIMRREFQDAGALHREEDDGPEGSQGSGGTGSGG